MGSRRYIPGENAAKRVLRQEVGFGCPICRRPFLEYHHFDPPWREKKHYDPKGMIALCPHHHYIAEGGHYTKSFLHRLKQKTHSPNDVKEIYPWCRREFLIRLGSQYTIGSRAILIFGGEEIIRIKRGEEDLLFLSFLLRSEDGQVIASMQENMFEFGSRIPYDFTTTTTANSIKVWSGKRQIGLSVTLKQYDIEEIDRFLAEDAERSEIMFLDHLKTLPDDFAERMRAEPPFANRGRSFILDWAQQQGLDSDGGIVLLNFEALSAYHEGQNLRVQNGNFAPYGNMHINFNVSIGTDRAFAFD